MLQNNALWCARLSSKAQKMVRVTGVEPAWTCAQDMWVAATYTRIMREGFQPSPCLPLDAHYLAQRVYHVYQVTLRFHHRVNGLVRHRRLVDDVRILTALDAGSCLGVIVEREAALRSARDMARPAPWLQLMNLSGLPLPRTMYERAPMLPGMIPMSPS